MSNSEMITEGTSKSFKNMFFEEKNEALEKEKKFQELSESKKLQLNIQIGNIGKEILDLRGKFEASLLDPNADSVKLQCRLLAAQEELSIAQDLLKMLFPG